MDLVQQKLDALFDEFQIRCARDPSMMEKCLRHWQSIDPSILVRKSLKERAGYADFVTTEFCRTATRDELLLLQQSQGTFIPLQVAAIGNMACVELALE